MELKNKGEDLTVKSLLQVGSQMFVSHSADTVQWSPRNIPGSRNYVKQKLIAFGQIQCHRLDE